MYAAAMNPSALIGPVSVGVAAGVCSALLLAAGSGGYVLPGFLLFVLSPLPAYLAGLGWGPRAVVSVGAAGVAVTAILQGPLRSAVFLLAWVLPVAVVCWLVHLRRPAQALAAEAARQPGPAAPEWFAAGDLVAWLAVMAGIIAIASLLTFGADSETINQTARTLLERQLKAWTNAGGRVLTEAEVGALSVMFVRVLPVVSAMSWMGMMLLNLWLAGRILLTSGRLFRPWPRLAALVLPSWVLLAFAATLALACGSGLPALIAGGFASAFVTAFAVMGLAVLHWISHGKANRAGTLTAAYVSAVLLAPYGTLPMAVVGVLEPWLRLRRRTPGPPPPPAPPGRPPPAPPGAPV